MRVFIGHQQPDIAIARRLADLLREADHEPWLAERRLASGNDGLSATILRQIFQCDAAAFLVTSNFRDDSYLAKEIEWAVGRRESDPDFRIIPLLLRDESGEPPFPHILHDYAFRRLTGELDAATELLRALRVRAPKSEGSSDERPPHAADLSRAHLREFSMGLQNGRTLDLTCIKEPYGGKLLAEELPAALDGKRALDLGTGCGIIGLAAASLGAQVTMIDISMNECELAFDNTASNNLSANVIHADYFEPGAIPPGGYDVILSNPAQLPSRSSFDLRECGGIDGWAHIDRILDIASEQLAPQGFALLYVLDFLGISYPTGEREPLRDRVAKRGLRSSRRRFCRRRLGLGSPVFRELQHIAQLYPQAEFLRDVDGMSRLPPSEAIDAALCGESLFLTASIVKLRRTGSAHNDH